ncbi:major histocompatibility complex class I-related gene protein-like isoform 2-T2 [Fundulus diaphanus]
MHKSRLESHTPTGTRRGCTPDTDKLLIGCFERQRKMIKLLLFYLFCKASSAEKHSLRFMTTASSGLSDFPEMEISVMIDDNSIGFCDGSSKTLKINYDWLKKVLHDDPELSKWFEGECFERQLNGNKGRLSILKDIFKKTEGVHVFQLMSSCYWDEETQRGDGVMRFGYNGEDFIALDLETPKWIALQPQATPMILAWDLNKVRLMKNKMFITQACPEWLKRSLIKGKSILLRTEHPSLSLLQKSSSSPVSCHATGFYPNRALMFWRKDGEEIHENVDYGEILPNDDGTFQMRVYLNISSISPEDWRRYDCVFQLHDKEDMIKLDEAVIRTNRGRHSNITTPIIAAVIAFVLVSITAAAGYVVYKRNRDRDHPLPTTSQENYVEL